MRYWTMSWNMVYMLCPWPQKLRLNLKICKSEKICEPLKWLCLVFKSIQPLRNNWWRVGVQWLLKSWGKCARWEGTWTGSWGWWVWQGGNRIALVTDGGRMTDREIHYLLYWKSLEKLEIFHNRFLRDFGKLINRNQMGNIYRYYLLIFKKSLF